MRKICLLVAAGAALVLIGIGTWVSVRTFTPTSALAGSTVIPSAMIGAKSLPTSHYDDYSLVNY
jgi:hypothetical protein